MPTRDPQRSIDLLYWRILRTLCLGLACLEAALLGARILHGFGAPVLTALLVVPLVQAILALLAGVLLTRARPCQGLADGVYAGLMVLMSCQVVLTSIWTRDPIRLFLFAIILVLQGVFQRNHRLYVCSLGLTLCCLGLGLSKVSLPWASVPLVLGMFGASALLGLLLHLLVTGMVDRVQRLLGRHPETRREKVPLREFIPMCSHCKKVRNGQGYWEQVETFITSRTRIEVTHGICPDCIESQWPEVVAVRSGRMHIQI